MKKGDKKELDISQEWKPKTNNKQNYEILIQLFYAYFPTNTKYMKNQSLQGENINKTEKG